MNTKINKKILMKKREKLQEAKYKKFLNVKELLG